MNCRLLIVMLIPAVVLIAAAPPSPPTVPPSAPDHQQQQQQQQEIPWPVQLGMRVMQLEQAWPLIDRVVLVPDVETYVDELSKWSPQGRWPVLIEDQQLAPMFIRRFDPAQVLRRESIAATENEINQSTIERLVVSAWGGDPERMTIRDVLAASGYTPPGVVVASMRDRAWPAAAALAAGRGQPLIWIDDSYRMPNHVMERPMADELAARIEAGLDELGYPYQRLGDAIDAITICRSMAGRVNLPRPDNQELEPAAITDYLGRRGGSSRYALVGWIFGDETRSAYMAMCSLFLPRVNVLMYNTYGEDGDWQAYDMTAPTAILAERGCEVLHFNGGRAALPNWLGMLTGGIEADVVVMNTRGNAREFHLHSGKASSLDVPVLTTPAALHLTHSWSMQSPANSATVGGRWLDRGVYAYVGSAHEPYLSAFLPPQMLTQRWMSGVPFLVGARHWQAPPPFGGPWKVNTIGDPLMMMPPPIQFITERKHVPAEYGVDLSDHVERTMRRIRDDDTGEAIAEAIALLDLLGRDEIALALWQLAEDSGPTQTRLAAPAALGPLFRARDVDGFFRAWDELDRRGAHATDMLWHLVTPRLQAMRDEDRLLQLQAAIRRELPHVDISRLGPALARAFGSAHVRNVIEREIERTDAAHIERELREVLRDF